MMGKTATSHGQHVATNMMNKFLSNSQGKSQFQHHFPARPWYSSEEPDCQVIESFSWWIKEYYKHIFTLLNCVDWNTSTVFLSHLLGMYWKLYPEHWHYQYHHHQNYLLSCYVTCDSLQDQHHMVSMKSISARNCGVSNSNLTWKNADRCSNCFSVAGRILF